MTEESGSDDEPSPADGPADDPDAEDVESSPGTDVSDDEGADTAESDERRVRDPEERVDVDEHDPSATGPVDHEETDGDVEQPDDWGPGGDVENPESVDVSDQRGDDGNEDDEWEISEYRTADGEEGEEVTPATPKGRHPEASEAATGDPAAPDGDAAPADGETPDPPRKADADTYAGQQEAHSGPSGGATPAGAGSPTGAGAGAGGAPASSAPDDQEMPLAVHIEEMVSRLGVVFVVMALVAAPVFLFAEHIINFLWYSFLPGTFEQCPTTTDPNVACPHIYHPLALLFARIKVATLAGFVMAMPVLVYESYLFMRPGLYPRERRYYLASVPTSLVLAVVGNLFAYFLVLPVLFQYFTSYSRSAADISFSLTETFNLIVMMLGFFALVFQIPLLIMLAIMMGVTSRRWLASKRLYFWGAFATIAFIFSPDPTGMAPILVAATMVGLFEGTLFLLKWTGN